VLAEGYGQDLVTAIMRPFTIYGPGQEGMLVANLAHRVVAEEPVTIVGDPGLVINPVHVDDAARAFAAALALDRSAAFNVAGSETVSLTGLVELLAGVAGTRPPLSHTDGAGGALVGDITRMRGSLGVTPRVDLKAGLADVVSALAGRAR
jgi:nucleoside-diphosphate-sugar epimerase